MHADHRLERTERPRQLAHVGVELDAHRARRVHLRVRDLVGLRDVAQSRRLADLVVEGHQREAEAEHRDHDDAELDEQRPIRCGGRRSSAHSFLRSPRRNRRVERIERSAAGSVGDAPFGSLLSPPSLIRKFLPIANARNSSTAALITPIPITGPPRIRAAMMPTKNIAAIDAKVSAVRRLAALRRAASAASVESRCRSITNSSTPVHPRARYPFI